MCVWVYMQSMPLNLGQLQLAFLLIMAIQTCLQGYVLSVSALLQHYSHDFHWTDLAKSAPPPPPPKKNKFHLSLWASLFLSTALLIKLQALTVNTKFFFYNFFFFKEGQHVHETTMLSIFALCACPSVPHIYTYNTAKQYARYRPTTDPISTWLFLTATITDCRSRQRHWRHSLRSSNDVNDRKVCSSFYGSSSV
jgi:hypothetical protein